MTDDLRVRRYEGADKNAVWAVHDAAFRASPMTYIPDYNRYLRRIPEAFIDPGGEFLVGTLPADAAGPGEYGPPDERVVAVSGFQPLDEGAGGGSGKGDEEADGAPTAKMRSVRVHPAFQRRGYGRTVVTALEERARDAGYERLVLTTNDDLSAAQALYRHLGYEETAREHHPEVGALVRFTKRL